jgi:hypothetical protein
MKITKINRTQLRHDPGSTHSFHRPRSRKDAMKEAQYEVLGNGAKRNAGPLPRKSFGASPQISHAICIRTLVAG